MLIKRAVVSIGVLCAAACGDDVSGPSAVPGTYRLVSVNGQQLPWVYPPSSGIPATIEHGQLHLRGDGTFGIGFGGTIAEFITGNYRVTSDNRAVLTRGGVPPDSFSITVGGDSAVFQRDVRFVFRRISTSQSIGSGVFVLAAINGSGPPLTEFDTVINGERFVARVHFDTLQIIDAMFYRRHRSESDVQYLTSGDSLFSSAEWTTYGAHEGITGGVVLRPFFQNSRELRSDTLRFAGNDLVRRTPRVTGIQEDRYVRR